MSRAAELEAVMAWVDENMPVGKYRGCLTPKQREKLERLIALAKDLAAA